MPIKVTPEIGVPLPNSFETEGPEGFRETANRYYHTVRTLNDAGMNVLLTDDDKALSHELMQTESLEGKELTAGSVVNLEALLSQWDYEILDVSKRLRNYVTNRLIVESEEQTGKDRLRSLEMLGKISTVGLFAERKDITVTHRTVTDIESELAKTLSLYANQPIEDAIYNPITTADEDFVDEDVDEESTYEEDLLDESDEDSTDDSTTDEDEIGRAHV